MEDTGFRDLVDRHWRPCYALAYRLTRDAAAAEDIAQEAFLRLHRRGSRLAPDTNFGGYLRRTVVRLVIDRVRRNARRPEVPLPENRDPAAPEVSVPEGLAEAVRAHLLRMPRREAEVFTLRVVEDLSTAETADALGIGEGTVRRYLFDAVRRLREALGEWNQP
jgi:RNA polymerase sigma-70 factor (ECF subfamily)